MSKFLLISLSLILTILPSYGGRYSRAGIQDALKYNHYRAAAGHNSYEAPECITDTPAPRGYRPIYVSHYGRHGSRYQGGKHYFRKVLPLLDSMALDGLLSPVGDSLRYEINLMYEAHDDMVGLLTMKGSREQTYLASRLYDRVPRLFKQKKSAEIHASATSATRCLQSMAAFVTEIKGLSPKVNVIYKTGQDKNLHYLAPRVSPKDKEFIRSHFIPLQDSLISVAPACKSVSERLFSDVSKATALLTDRTLNSFIYELFEAAQGAGCLDINVDPLRFFTVEELYDFLEIRNLYFCGNYGPLAPIKDMRAKMAIPLLRGIVQETDAALAGNGRCADFRFGHDAGLGPLLMLIGVDGFDKGIDPYNSILEWPAWKYTPMCSNLQMIFYRNRKGDVLVKFLRNEIETTIPALESIDGVYYKWLDVRRYFLQRTGDYKVLPEYYNEYLDKKISEISELRKKEGDGFIFWTDTHFSDNAGNAAAIIERLQSKLGPIKLFWGGDSVKNSDILEISGNTSSLLQAGLYGNLFPIRGNHDFISSTSKLIKEPKLMGNLAVSRYLNSFLFPSAVKYDSNTDVNYYYVDSPGCKIRYVIFDTTDSVKDSKIKYGISDRQAQWLQDDVISTLPKDWKLFYLSHVPFAIDHNSFKTLLDVTQIIEKNDKSLLCLSGHRHSDIESGIGSVFQVITAADCLEDMGRTILPYATCPKFKEAGTVNEQTLDYVSVSKDLRKVVMKRIGWGNDRIFNVKPIVAEVGNTINLTIDGTPIGWFVFDEQGNKISPYNEEHLRYYHTSHSNATISNSGELYCEHVGSCIVVAIHDDSSKEYFMVKIK